MFSPEHGNAGIFSYYQERFITKANFEHLVGEPEGDHMPPPPIGDRVKGVSREIGLRVYYGRTSSHKKIAHALIGNNSIMGPNNRRL